MTARKKSKEIQKAESQKIQEEVHRVLFCDTNWSEEEVYGQRFQKIIERSNLSEVSINISDNIASEYKRRIQRKLISKEPLNKSLVFYQILTKIEYRPMDSATLFTEIKNHSVDCIMENLIYLQLSGFIEKGSKEYRKEKIFFKL